MVGDQWVTIALTVFVKRDGIRRPSAAAPVAATVVTTRNAARTSDVQTRRVDMGRLLFGSRTDIGRRRYYGRAERLDCVRIRR
jgi:hypothetical protein